MRRASLGSCGGHDVGGEEKRKRETTRPIDAAAYSPRALRFRTRRREGHQGRATNSAVDLSLRREGEEEEEGKGGRGGSIRGPYPDPQPPSCFARSVMMSAALQQETRRLQEDCAALRAQAKASMANASHEVTATSFFPPFPLPPPPFLSHRCIATAALPLWRQQNARARTAPWRPPRRGARPLRLRSSPMALMECCCCARQRPKCRQDT